MSISMPRVRAVWQHEYCIEPSIEVVLLVIRIERTYPDPRHAQPSARTARRPSRPGFNKRRMEDDDAPSRLRCRGRGTRNVTAERPGKVPARPLRRHDAHDRAA